MTPQAIDKKNDQTFGARRIGRLAAGSLLKIIKMRRFGVKLLTPHPASWSNSGVSFDVCLRESNNTGFR